MLRAPVRDLPVFLTGAASGIGRAVAVAAASAGAVLFLTDVDESGLRRIVEEIRAGGGRRTTSARWSSCCCSSGTTTCSRRR